MMPKSSGWSAGCQHGGKALFKTDHISFVFNEFERRQGFANHLTARRVVRPASLSLDYHDALRRAIGKAHTFEALADLERIVR
jgi:hypothetical protein